jgi:hypothetical protein
MRIRTVRQAGVLRFSRTLFFCIEGDTERTDSAQQQADFSPRLAFLRFHNPLPADTDLLRQRLLVEAKPGAVVADKGPEIGRCSNAHVFLQMSAYDDIVSKSASGDKLKSQRSTTFRNVSDRRHVGQEPNKSEGRRAGRGEFLITQHRNSLEKCTCTPYRKISAGR